MCFDATVLARMKTPMNGTRDKRTERDMLLELGAVQESASLAHPEKSHICLSDIQIEAVIMGVDNPFSFFSFFSPCLSHAEEENQNKLSPLRSQFFRRIASRLVSFRVFV